MKFTSAKEITEKAATIRADVREAVAAERAGLRVETKPIELPVPEELKEKFGEDPKFRRAFEAPSPGRGGSGRGLRGRARCVRFCGSAHGL